MLTFAPLSVVFVSELVELSILSVSLALMPLPKE
jgi:hypothetical protein